MRLLACLGPRSRNLDDQTKARAIIPAERSKNGRPHLIPLSEPARQTIKAALELIDGDDRYVFPSPSVREAPITAHALAVAMARFAKHLDVDAPGNASRTAGRAARFPGAEKTWRADPPSPHDLRRTVGTRLAEIGIAKEDRDAVLNHTPRDVGKKHYDLYDREREKRRALGLWAATLAEIIEDRRGGRVVLITKAKR